MALLVVLTLAGAACRADAGADIVVQPVTRVPATPTPDLVSEPTATPTPVAEPELILSTASTQQAGAILVSVTGDVASGTVTFLGRTYELTGGARSMYSFVGIGVLDEPGVFPLTVNFRTANGSEGSMTEEVTIAPTEWTVEYLEFSPETSALLDPDIVAAENALLTSVYATFTPEKLWDGPFLVPVDGLLTARFGEQRSINGSEPSGHHGGTDFGAEEGTPVVATNSGRVVLARQLDVRGNMVVIDHGGGVLSGYAHLAAFAVAEGQMVERGQVIATVGNTGLSTGAHLHWEMAVHGILVDALLWTDGTNGF